VSERDSIDGFIETAFLHFRGLAPEVEGLADRIWKLSDPASARAGVRAWRLRSRHRRPSSVRSTPVRGDVRR
jgi:hypothetical protein